MENFKVGLILYLFLLSLLSCGSVNAQENGWFPAGHPRLASKDWKREGNITYFVDSTMHLCQRNEIIHKTKEYIADNLRFINEFNFDDSVYVVITRDRNEMKKYFGRNFGGFAHIKNEYEPFNWIYAIYGKGNSPLKHELMHLVVETKWGEPLDPSRLTWLSEGLAMLADPELDNNEERTFEEKYVYFLQTNRLLSTEDLMLPFSEHKMPQVKIIYAQSAYIVEYLIRNYGMSKVKQMWNTYMVFFESVFGFTFEQLMLDISKELNKKYPDPINLDWDKFNQRGY